MKYILMKGGNVHSELIDGLFCLVNLLSKVVGMYRYFDKLIM